MSGALPELIVPYSTELSLPLISVSPFLIASRTNNPGMPQNVEDVVNHGKLAVHGFANFLLDPLLRFLFAHYILMEI